MSGAVVTVGSFDGVHLGHRAVLEEIALRARRANRRSLLVTFEPHPMEVVNPQAAPPLLTLDAERREVLAQSDLDAVVFFTFTKALSHRTPEEFIDLLQRQFAMQELVIGHDHGFGRGRAGGADTVRRMGTDRGFEVDVVAPVVVDGREVSSTLIRRAVAGGDLDTASRLLGRPYSMTGRVIPGDARGRTIGYPTINLTAPGPRKLLPPEGVYAVRAEWQDGNSGGMMHMGPRPTFGDRAPVLEVHLLDGRPELYDREVKISWVARLRDVRPFASADALREQLARDQEHTRAVLAVSPSARTH